MNSSDLSNYLMNLYNHPRLQKLIVLNEDKKNIINISLKISLKRKKAGLKQLTLKIFIKV